MKEKPGKHFGDSQTCLAPGKNEIQTCSGPLSGPELYIVSYLPWQQLPWQQSPGQQEFLAERLDTWAIAVTARTTATEKTARMRFISNLLDGEAALKA